MTARGSVTSEDRLPLIDQHRIDEAKGLNTGGDLAQLLLWMFAGIARPGLELGDVYLRRHELALLLQDSDSHAGSMAQTSRASLGPSGCQELFEP